MALDKSVGTSYPGVLIGVSLLAEEISGGPATGCMSSLADAMGWCGEAVSCGASTSFRIELCGISADCRAAESASRCDSNHIVGTEVTKLYRTKYW